MLRNVKVYVKMNEKLRIAAKHLFEMHPARDRAPLI